MLQKDSDDYMMEDTAGFGSPGRRTNGVIGTENRVTIFLRFSESCTFLHTPKEDCNAHLKHQADCPFYVWPNV